MLSRMFTGENLHGATIPGEMLALEPRYLFDAAAAITADVTTDTGTGDTSTTSNDTSPGPADSSQQETTAFLDSIVAPAAVTDLLIDKQIIDSFENLPPGTTVGFVESNQGSGDLTYTITGGSGETAYFLEEATGRIRVLDPSQINFESSPVETLIVQVTDSSGDTDTTTITINIADTNDAPTIDSVDGPSPDPVAAGNTVVTQIDASDEDGDEISYQLVNAPEGASIDSNGLFSWTTTAGDIGTTTIQVSISNDFDPSLAQLVSFDVNVTTVPEPEPVPETETEEDPFSPTNDSNNSNPVTTSSATSTTPVGAEFIDDSTRSEPFGTEAEIIRDSVHAAEARDASQLETDSTEFDTTDEDGSVFLASSEVAAMDADVAEIQRLIDAGKDPTLLTPATAAGISKQLMQQATTPEAQIAEILSIMEEVTNLIGCGR
ncbi:MAG: LEPR-XLL domain-containing protein [Gammaproteobacteria bacterium]|nr:LEPR-XLL domain-containing protein [Gammaproteobacteria bacterium]